MLLSLLPNQKQVKPLTLTAKEQQTDLYVNFACMYITPYKMF